MCDVNGRRFGTPRLVLLLAAALLLGGTVARADEPPPLAADAPIATILDALQTRGDTLKDFSADVSLTTLNGGTQVQTMQTGQAWFANDPKTGERLRVNFNAEKNSAGIVTPINHQYILDGLDLLEIDFKKQRITTSQVLKPGQKMNLMKLGEGPFPLPIGQDPKLVQDQFAVTKPAAAKDDPPGTAHISLAPKEGTSLARKFTSIDVFVDCKTNMPVRVVTLDQSGDTLRTTQLDKLQINKGLAANAFDVPPAAAAFEKVNGPFESDK
jgi:outer membrane lipoprotein-sorting protein